MASIHILGFNADGNSKIIIHESIPGGNNTVSKAWKDCYLAESTKKDQDGVWVGPTSRLKVGTAPGNISQSELDTIEAGDVIELEKSIKIESGSGSVSEVKSTVSKIVLEELKLFKRKYRYYGKEIS